MNEKEIGISLTDTIAKSDLTKIAPDCLGIAIDSAMDYGIVKNVY